jgi:hypothetical protein
MNLYGTSHEANAYIDAQVKSWASLQRNGNGGGKLAVVSALVKRSYFAVLCARLLSNPMGFDLAWGSNNNKNFEGICILVDEEVKHKLRALGEQLNAIPAVRERLIANGCAHNTTVGASRVWHALTRDTEALRELFRTDLTRRELGGNLVKRYEFVDFYDSVQFVEARETAPNFLLVTDASFGLPAAASVSIQKNCDGNWVVKIGEKSIAPKIHITHALRQLAREMQR